MCDTAVRLRFEIERLREALQPFAQFAKEFDEKVYPPEDDDQRLVFSLGECRKARAALEDNGT
jgi:hypothetical protein